MFYKSAGSQFNYDGYIWVWVWAWILGLVTEWAGLIQASTEQDIWSIQPRTMVLIHRFWSCQMLGEAGWPEIIPSMKR